MTLRYEPWAVSIVFVALAACGGETQEQKTKNPPPLATTSASAQNRPAPPAVDKTKELAKLASDAFVFGYSPLFMEREKRTMTTNVRHPLGMFAHATHLPRPEEADVLPSLDSLLSSAWIDLHDDAWTLKLPDMGDRWFDIQLFDAYGEPIGVVSKKANGTKAQVVAITGPGFKGTVPAGAKEMKSTTSTVWLLGRTRVTSDNDVAKVSALLKQWSLQPVPPAVAPKDFPPPPLGRPQDLKFGGPEILDELGDVLKTEPPPADVTDALAKKYVPLADLAKAGIGPGLSPNKTLPQEQLASLSQGIKDGAEQVEQALEHLPTRKNGWDLDAGFGQRGADPIKQSAWVLRGLDWPVASEGLVYIARVDDGDRVLSGAHEYAIHFDKSKLPPRRRSGASRCTPRAPAASSPAPNASRSRTRTSRRTPTVRST